MKFIENPIENLIEPNGFWKIVTVKFFDIFVQQVIGVNDIHSQLMVNVLKNILIFNMLWKVYNIDYEENVLEIKFEEIDFDEVQHVEENLYRQSSVCIGKLNNFKSAVESKLSDIKHDESNYTVQCQMISKIEMCHAHVLWKVILMKVNILEQILINSLCRGK